MEGKVTTFSLFFQGILLIKAGGSGGEIIIIVDFSRWLIMVLFLYCTIIAV